MHRISLLPDNYRPYILGIVALIVIIRAAVYLFSQNRQAGGLTPGATGNYGLAGGAICPKCQRPFALSIASVKLGFGVRFTRCPNCGKWNVVRRASAANLRAAETTGLSEAQAWDPASEKSEKEKLADLMDQSRFTDRS